MIAEKFSRRYVVGLALAGLAIFLVAQGAAYLSSGYASQQTSVAVAPFFQLPGGSVVVSGQGFEPNANVTIYVKNVIAKVETQKAGESAKTTTFPDQIVAGTTQTDSNGNLEWALGVPRDEVKIIERWISNSTGQEEVLKTVTTTYTFQGTVKIIVMDQLGNHASDELTIIKWISRSPF